MDRVFVPGLIVVTSLSVWALATRRGLSSAALPRAVGRALETAGIAVGFVVLNLAVGAIAVIGVRTLAHRFVSFYAMNDAALVLLALGQALVFQAWRDENERNSRR